MCGIYGIWRTDRQPVDTDALESAVTRLRHRGPDDEGYLLVNTGSGHAHACAGSETDTRLALPHLASSSADAFDLALGHRRLAVLDLSPAGHQPMAASDGRTWIVYNGEVYNYLDLRSELANRGYSFRTGTDTEVVLAAYREWGPGCLPRLNGMWAFAIWDDVERRLFLARDRFGIKPLYYAFDGTTFAFASEIKALVGRRATVPFCPDDRAVYSYLAIGLLPSPTRGDTFFGGVRSLPPAHWLRLDLSGRLAQQRYWTIPAEPATTGSDANAAVHEYRALFTDAVRLRLQSDVPVGSCLSGGLDSSSIVCVVNRLVREEGIPAAQIGDRQKTFSAVYETQGRYNERAYVDKVANATGAECNLVFPSAQRLRDDLTRLVWHQEEPFPSTSIFAQWCVMGRVRESATTVLLDGQGADELLGGYRPFPLYLDGVLRREGLLRMMRETYAVHQTTSIPVLSLAGRAMAHQLPRACADALRRVRERQRADLGALQPDFASHYRPLVSLHVADWGSHGSFDQHLRTIVQEANLPHLLRYEDRSSMACGVEARVPFLDHRLVELSFTVAAPWRIHDGWTKWVQRRAMEGLVPGEVVWRRDKVGFETPERDWLGHMVRADLPVFHDRPASSAYLDLKAVRSEARGRLERGADVSPIWRWINLDEWLRVWQGA